MVKTFKDFIEEGMWSKTFDRARTGEKRTEEKTEIDKYIETIEWVDMGHPKYLFAKIDYPFKYTISIDVVDNNSFFSFNEIDTIKKHLPKDISIMGGKEIDWLKKNSHFSYDSKYKNKATYVNVISGMNENRITFSIIKPPNRYFDVYYYHGLQKNQPSGSYERFRNITCSRVDLFEKPTPLGRKKSKFTQSLDDKIFLIKLIKLK